MNFRLSFILISGLLITGCSNISLKEHPSEHGEPKIQFTAYTDKLELFAEADPFVAGDSANVLSHFSSLPGFRPLENASIKLALIINGSETSQILDNTSNKGIYSFYLVPDSEGTGTLKYEISADGYKDELLIRDVTVYGNHEAAHEAAEKNSPSRTNTSVFTKEQSWKVDFASQFPVKEKFGQVIKTTGLIEPVRNNEYILPARTDGIVQFASPGIYEGKEVKPGQALFSIMGNTLADNNISVRYSQAKNNFERSSADFERALFLIKDKIIPEKEFLEIRNRFENDKSVFENLKNSFNTSGQIVSSPVTGFIRQTLARNGEYVKAGQDLLIISNDNSLIISTDIPQRFLPLLQKLETATIRKINDDRTYTLEELGGRIVSYGKAANSENFLIPVILGVENNGDFIPGSFVEVYLETGSGEESLVIPNTAILEEQGIFFVWVQITPELFEKREIKTGKTDGLRTEILSGLSGDERIVTKGAIYIKLAQATGTLDAHSGHVH